MRIVVFSSRAARRALGLALACLVTIAALPAAASADSGAPVLAPVAPHANPYRALFVDAGQAPAPAAQPSLGDADLSVSPQQEQPPPVEHTGWGTLLKSTGRDFVAFPKRKSTWVILGIGAASAALAHPVDDDLNSHLAGTGAGRVFKVGKYLGYGWVQAGAAVGTYAVGRYMIHPPEGRTNKISHVGFDLLRANILTQSFTYGLKYAVRRDRPTGECCAFPSGHASVTFAAAAVLERHFGYRNAWPTFVIAGYVAASRLHDNKHFLSDVLFGSALGMASGWTVVGRHGREEYALAPIAVPRGVGVALTLTPRDAHGRS